METQTNRTITFGLIEPSWPESGRLTGRLIDVEHSREKDSSIVEINARSHYIATGEGLSVSLLHRPVV